MNSIWKNPCPRRRGRHRIAADGRVDDERFDRRRRGARALQPAVTEFSGLSLSHREVRDPENGPIVCVAGVETCAIR